MYSSVKDDTVHTLKTSAQNVKDEARGTAKDLRETANQAGKKVRSFIDTATTEFSSASDTVTTHIHEKPLQSSLIALGVGFVLGALLIR